VAAYTVTAAWTGAASANGGALTVKVLTGAAAVQNGQIASSNTITTPQLAITPNATDSLVYGVVGQFNTSATFTANGSTTFSQNVADGVNNVCYGTFRSTATTTSGSPVTLGATLPTESSGLIDLALAEILVAAGQTLAEDASSGTNSTTGAETLAYGPFTPPAGSLIVVQVCPNGTGGTPETTAVTSVPALTFTPLVTTGASTNASLGIWIAFVPPAGSPGPAAPGQTWRRRFHHPQVMPPPPAVPLVSVAGVTATAALAAPAGSVSAGATVAGPVATVAIAAPAGSVSAGAAVAGVTGTVAVAATAGTPAVVTAVSGVTATVALAAAAGSVKAGATIAGVVATTAVAAPAGTPSGGPPPFDSLPATPTYPLPLLGTRVELNLGGTWTDISTYVYERDQVIITRGHPDESTTTAPSKAALTLNNRDGRFSDLNPVGPYYGSIGQNTPLRISVPEGASYWRSETDQFSYASCPDTAGVSITGDMEIQLDLTLDNWNQAQTLACKWAASTNQRTWILELLENGTLLFNFSSSGSGIDSAPSTVPVPLPPLRRMCLRVTYASGSGTVTFWTSPPGLSSPVWTQLGTAQVFGAVSLFNSTATVQAGGGSDTDDGYPGVYGKVHAFRLLSGIAGTVKASPDFTAQAPGATSFADAQSNTWTLHGTAEISSRKYRFHGEVAAWPQAWDSTGADVWVQITASGVLRRLGQNASGQVFQSAMYRAYARLSGSTAPVAYWPCEDGSASTQIASGLGGPAMQVTIPPQFASSSAFLCSNPIPALAAGSTWSGAVPAYTGGVDNVLRFLMQVPSGGDTNGGIIARMYTTGTITRADLVYSTGGVLSMLVYSGTTLLSTFGPAAFGLNGELIRVSLELQASGGNVLCNFVTLVAGASVGLDDSNTQSSASVGNVTQVVINPGGLLTSTAIGQISVQPVWTSLFDLAGPLDAWQGEQAGVRFKRLCDEESIGFRGQGSLHDTVLMGPQSPEALTTLLQECADADRGSVVEPRQAGPGLGYRTRGSLLNQSPAVTLSYTAAHLSDDLKPTRDDQQLQNDVTVSQGAGASSASGSSSEQVLASGPLSIQQPPNGAGRYAAQATINVAAASQLDSQAMWMVWMGTVNQPRYPLVNVDLERSAIAAHYWDLQDLDLGDYLAVTSSPAWLPPDGINQLVQGVTEVLYGYVFHEAWQCVPQSPWNVLVWNDLVWGRWTTAGATLHASISSGATSMLVDSPNSLWTTSGGDFPFDLILAGERVTVTNITGASSPQTFTITRAVNGVSKGQTAGAAVDLFYPPIWSL
jgi:hypothetical protein